MTMYTLEQVQKITANAIHQVVADSQARSDVAHAMVSTALGAVGGAAVATGMATMAAGETIVAGSALSGATAMLGGKAAVAAIVVPFGTVFFRNAVVIGAVAGLAGWMTYRYAWPRAKAWAKARQARKADEARGVTHADHIEQPDRPMEPTAAPVEPAMAPA